MPAKGEKYNAVDVDLKAYCEEWLKHTGRRQADLARTLGIGRQRVNDMCNGTANTAKYCEIIVIKLEGGKWMNMEKYATSEAGMEYLREMQRTKSLSPLELKVFKLIKEKGYREIEEARRAGTLKDLEKSLLNSKKGRGRPKKKV